VNTHFISVWPMDLFLKKILTTTLDNMHEERENGYKSNHEGNEIIRDWYYMYFIFCVVDSSSFLSNINTYILTWRETGNICTFNGWLWNSWSRLWGIDWNNRKIYKIKWNKNSFSFFSCRSFVRFVARLLLFLGENSVFYMLYFPLSAVSLVFV